MQKEQTDKNDPLGGGGENSSGVFRATIDPALLGHATITPDGDVVAGSWNTFTLTYTAGAYGIDDSGSLRICFRFASDQTPPQFDEPDGVNYTTITASNGAVLYYRFDPKGNVRPWDKTLYIKVVEGFLLPGDTITVRFGVTEHGGPGMRMQTFCEDSCEFRVLVDPIATFNYQPLPEHPTVRVVPGPVERLVATLPTRRIAGQPFSLHVKGEDRWGNPTDKCDMTLFPVASMDIAGLPGQICLRPGKKAILIEGLHIHTTGVLDLSLTDMDGAVIVRANPLEIVETAPLLPYWADLHGQSEETIGTGSAHDYFAFARDLAPVDATSHQGNDFQITNEFWAHLDHLTDVFEEPGRFLAVPGYEWSGNTGLGGDRNVFFPETGRKIRRSSHALIGDKSDIGSDELTAAGLFRAFAENEEWDVICYAHCGGRYADIAVAHDGRFEKSVEIHSSWGSFEWLLQDAFRLGYRVGIVANSDGHKGRPGASYPGASMFGAIGGLTCLLMPDLTREALFDCLRKRRHYATTGGVNGRPIVDVAASFSAPAQIYTDDPALGPSTPTPQTSALMGDIVHLRQGRATLSVAVRAAVPIERIDIFNGDDLVESIRPHVKTPLGRRIRMIWQGAEYRGRFRQVIWDGGATVAGNEIVSASGINFFNPDKPLVRETGNAVAWSALTTGNLGGVDLWLKYPDAGQISIETPLVAETLDIEDIGSEEIVFDRAAALPRDLRIFRLPDQLDTCDVSLQRELRLNERGDNPIFIRVTLEDGTRSWSSPIYIFR